MWFVLTAVCLLHCVNGQTTKKCVSGTKTKWKIDSGCDIASTTACAADCVDATITDHYYNGRPKIHSCIKCTPGKAKQFSTSQKIPAIKQGGEFAFHPAYTKLKSCPTKNTDGEENEVCEPCESGKVAPEPGSKSCKACGSGEFVISVTPCDNSPLVCSGCDCSGTDRGLCAAPIEIEVEGFTVTIGSSSINTKTVTAAQQGTITCPSVVNRDNWLTDDSYSDTFAITIVGKEITARRSDSTNDWGMNLKFQCTSTEGAESEWKRKCECKDGYDGTDCSTISSGKLCVNCSSWVCTLGHCFKRSSF